MGRWQSFGVEQRHLSVGCDRRLVTPVAGHWSHLDACAGQDLTAPVDVSEKLRPGEDAARERIRVLIERRWRHPPLEVSAQVVIETRQRVVTEEPGRRVMQSTVWETTRSRTDRPQIRPPTIRLDSPSAPPPSAATRCQSCVRSSGRVRRSWLLHIRSRAEDPPSRPLKRETRTGTSALWRFGVRRRAPSLCLVRVES
jgi:hypothetical protein